MKLLPPPTPVQTLVTSLLLMYSLTVPEIYKECRKYYSADTLRKDNPFRFGTDEYLDWEIIANDNGKC